MNWEGFHFKFKVEDEPQGGEFYLHTFARSNCAINDVGLSSKQHPFKENLIPFHSAQTQILITPVSATPSEILELYAPLKTLYSPSGWISHRLWCGVRLEADSPAVFPSGQPA